MDVRKIVLRKVIVGRVAVSETLTSNHKTQTFGAAEYKKESPKQKLRGCYLLYFSTESPLGVAITDTSHRKAAVKNYEGAIRHLSEVSTFLSLASLSFRGVRSD